MKSSVKHKKINVATFYPESSILTIFGAEHNAMSVAFFPSRLDFMKNSLNYV